MFVKLSNDVVDCDCTLERDGVAESTNASLVSEFRPCYVPGAVLDTIRCEE